MERSLCICRARNHCDSRFVQWYKTADFGEARSDVSGAGCYDDRGSQTKTLPRKRKLRITRSSLPVRERCCVVYCSQEGVRQACTRARRSSTRRNVNPQPANKTTHSSGSHVTGQTPSSVDTLLVISYHRNRKNPLNSCGKDSVFFAGTVHPPVSLRCPHACLATSTQRRRQLRSLEYNATKCTWGSVLAPKNCTRTRCDPLKNENFSAEYMDFQIIQENGAGSEGWLPAQQPTYTSTVAGGGTHRVQKT